MEFNIASFQSRKKSDLLVIPFWKGSKCGETAVDAAHLLKLFSGILDTHDFQGAEGELLIQYVSDFPENRIALLGLGVQENLNVEKLRRAYAQVAKKCHKKKWKSLNLLLPHSLSMSEKDVVRGICEGVLLPNYHFSSLKHDTLDDVPGFIEKATLVGGTKSDLALAKKCATICDSVYFARDLINGNADDVTPQYLAAVARGLDKSFKNVKTTVFDKKRIEKEKMGLILAVNQGSSSDPVFILVEYQGDPKSTDKTVIVGKGITFDTGGLLIKPRGGMETMKDDMSGAAAVLGTIHVLAALDLPINVTAVVPATENSVGPKSFKPGDVYKSYAGKTVEIGDTDAEGRLVLADAIAYAVKNLKPSRIIDIATLTGSIVIALGDELSGMMTNNDVLADLLVRAGSETGERVWRLPLLDDYKERLNSSIADIKNIGGRSGGAIIAGLFLQEFTGRLPWAHLDIAGTAFLSESKRYLPKHATGVGVRLLLSFLESLI